jgi:chromosome segregation ATPase
VECLRCLDLQKTIKLLKHKLMEYKTRGESSLSTRLTTDLDAEVGALRKDRDALKARAELLQAIIDNQRSEDSNTQLEEENRRLITIIAELRQKMAGMQQEHAEAIERLEVNLETAKSEAQLQKKSLRETHTQVLCRLDQSLLQIEMLNTLLQTCQTEAAQGLAASEARNTALVMECRKAGVKLTESQRLLREQQEQTRLLQEENADLVVQLKRAEADCKVLTDEIVKADANARGLNDLLEGSTDRLNAFIAGQGRGSETMERDLNRLREELRIVTMELSRAKSLLTEHQNFASKLQEDLANSAQEIRKLQEKVAMAVKRREAAEEEVKVQHCKLKEEKEMLEANVKQLSDERARSDGLQQQVLVKDAEIADLQKEIHKLQALLDEMSKKANENPSTKVVVVTPKITVSLPDGSAHDHGKMNLPKHVLQELVANQLGYTPDDLFQIDDVCELGPRKRN